MGDEYHSLRKSVEMPKWQAESFVAGERNKNNSVLVDYQ
jgi:hypothetical protein